MPPKARSSLLWAGGRDKPRTGKSAIRLVGNDAGQSSGAGWGNNAVTLAVTVQFRYPLCPAISHSEDIMRPELSDLAALRVAKLPGKCRNPWSPSTPHSPHGCADVLEDLRTPIDLHLFDCLPGHRAVEQSEVTARRADAGEGSTPGAPTGCGLASHC